MTLRWANLTALWWLAPSYMAWLAAWLWPTRTAQAAIAHALVVRLSSIKSSRMHRGLWAACLWMRAVSVALLAMGLLRPQMVRERQEVVSSGLDIALVIDTSASMKALDLDADRPVDRRRNRLEVVKSVVQQFVAHRPTDLISLVVFGAQAYSLCPLTLDHGVVDMFLQRVEPGMAGDSTAIGDGIAAAINRLRRSASKTKVAILLTDGRNNAGALSPKQAALAALALDLKIYTIGAGGLGDAPYPVPGPFGRMQMASIAADIDEDSLQEIAKLTGGAYFRAEDGRGLADIYARIDAMEKTPYRAPPKLSVHEYFAVPVIAALVLITLELVLRATRLLPIP